MSVQEVNFDGLVGATHNYAGLSFGNVASAASKWTVKEDLELVRLVKEHGANSGSWEPMAELFSTKFEGSTRSAGSLRGRWQRLEDEAAAVGTTVLDMRITLWQKTDKVVIKVRTSHKLCLREDGWADLKSNNLERNMDQLPRSSL